MFVIGETGGWRERGYGNSVFYSFFSLNFLFPKKKVYY